MLTYVSTNCYTDGKNLLSFFLSVVHKVFLELVLPSLGELEKLETHDSTIFLVLPNFH